MNFWKLLVAAALFISLFLSWSCWAYDDATDPDLRPGFPVLTMPENNSTSFWDDQQQLALGDINGDGNLEILFPTIDDDYLYAIEPDGSITPGWPVMIGRSASVALGKVLNRPNAVDVATTSSLGVYSLMDGTGTIQSGWPIYAGTTTLASSVMADVNDDSHDDIIVDNPDSGLVAFDYSGALIHAYQPPETDLYCQNYMWPPLILESNGNLNLITRSSGVGGPDGELDCLMDFKADGTLAYHKDIRPIKDPLAYYDKAGQPVLVATSIGDSDGRDTVVSFYDSLWTLKSSFDSPALDYNGNQARPVLADLDGDGIPEIVLAGGGTIYVYRIDGTPFPGWPVTLPGNNIGWLNPSGVAVGDLDGDGEPDIAVTFGGKVTVLDRFGRVVPGFPKDLNESSLCSHGFAEMSPAIGDIDGDGLNELVIAGWRFPCEQTNPPPQRSVFVYDLGGFPGGGVEWGQSRGNAQRTGVYKPIDATESATSVDLGYTVTFDQSELLTGRDNYATIVIDNKSSYQAHDVTFSLSFPEVDYASKVQLSGNEFTCITPRGRILCRSSEIPANSSVQLHMVIDSDKTADIKATAQLGQAGYEKELTDNYSTIEMNVLHLVPVANDQTVTTTVNHQISGTLSGNIDGYSGTLHFAISKMPDHGTVVLDDPSQGTFTYSPSSNYVGGDAFQFTVGNGDVESSPGIVAIVINPSVSSPKPPTGGSGGGGSLAFSVLLVLVGLLILRFRGARLA